MPKYKVYVLYTASKYIGEVEAEDEVEAEKKGWGLDYYVSLCHQCSNEVEIDDANEIQVDEI